VKANAWAGLVTVMSRVGLQVGVRPDEAPEVKALRFENGHLTPGGRAAGGVAGDGCTHGPFDCLDTLAAHAPLAP
jgi:hypothetical protein